MIELYRVPKPDENTEEITLGDRYVSEGDAINKEMPICQMIAQKGDFDYLALHDAVLLKWVIAPGSVVPVDTVFAIVGDAGEPVPDVSEENERILQARGEHLGGAAAVRVRATPAARRLAKKENVSLAAVRDAFHITGAVKPEDVETYLRNQNPS